MGIKNGQMVRKNDFMMRKRLSELLKEVRHFIGVIMDWKFYRVFPNAISVKVDNKKRIK